MGSPRHAGSPCISHRLLRGGSRRNSETETMCATPDFTLVFHPPELPEDTLMEVLGINENVDCTRPTNSPIPTVVPCLSSLLTAVPRRRSDGPALHFGFRPLRHGIGRFQKSGHVRHPQPGYLLSRAEPGGGSDQPVEQRLEVSAKRCPVERRELLHCYNNEFNL